MENIIDEDELFDKKCCGFHSMKKNITKQQVYDLGVDTPNNFIKLGNLSHIDYEGYVNGLRVFDKLTLETAIDSCVDEIVKDFDIQNMIEYLCESEFGFPSIGRTESSKVSELIVIGITCLNGGKYHGKTIEGNNLCDALWNTVKFIIGVN